MDKILNKIIHDKDKQIKLIRWMLLWSNCSATMKNQIKNQILMTLTNILSTQNQKIQIIKLIKPFG